MTIQFAEDPELTLVGLQERADTKVGATRVKPALCEDPLSVAVTVADCVVVMVPTVAVKLAEVALDATVTEAGTVSAALLLEIPTTLPPTGAA